MSGKSSPIQSASQLFSPTKRRGAIANKTIPLDKLLAEAVARAKEELDKARRINELMRNTVLELQKNRRETT